MRKITYDGYVPYSNDGNHYLYTSAKYPHPLVDGVWHHNVPFRAELKITGIERGRSAAHFVLHETSTNKRYIMFMTDLMNLIQNNVVDKGIIRGTWAFTKRGMNFGVIFLG